MAARSATAGGTCATPARTASGATGTARLGSCRRRLPPHPCCSSAEWLAPSSARGPVAARSASDERAVRPSSGQCRQSRCEGDQQREEGDQGRHGRRQGTVAAAQPRRGLQQPVDALPRRRWLLAQDRTPRCWFSSIRARAVVRWPQRREAVSSAASSTRRWVWSQKWAKSGTRGKPVARAVDRCSSQSWWARAWPRSWVRTASSWWEVRRCSAPVVTISWGGLPGSHQASGYSSSRTSRGHGRTADRRADRGPARAGGPGPGRADGGPR